MQEGAAQSTGSGPGARLTAAREQAGMTLQEAAERLRVDVSTLEALEAGRFQALGAAVFVRGHLRHYAELLGLPPEEIDAAYAASSARLAPLPDLRRTTTLSATGSSGSGALSPQVALIGAVVLVLAGWVWWAMRLPSARHHAPAAPAAPMAAPAADAGTPAPPESAATANAAPANPPAARGAGAAAKDAGKETRPGKLAAAPVRLAIKFEEDSWLEVYDAHSNTLYRDVGQAGSERHISGAGPLHVLVGNPDGVSIEIDGHPLALKPAAESGRPQRLLLDSSGQVSDAAAPSATP